MVRKVKLNNLDKKQLKEHIVKQRNEAGESLLMDFTYSLAWSLRLKGYGKVRIEKYINDFFEMISDVSRGGLLTVDDIKSQLKIECDLDLNKLIEKKLTDHYWRMKKAGYDI